MNKTSVIIQIDCHSVIQKHALPSFKAPHPMTAASLSVYWSLEPAGGKQTGDTVDVKKTGDSRVKMAISLYCKVNQTLVPFSRLVSPSLIIQFFE